MSFKWIFLVPILFWSMGSSGQKSVTVYKLGPNDLVLDARMIRGQFGYAWDKIPNFLDSAESRTAQLVELKCEFRMISSAMDKYMNFVVHDALYTDMAIGKMTSNGFGEPVAKSEDSEGKFAVSFNWGYDFFMGYRNRHWGLLAGIRPQWSMLSMGDFSSDATSGGLDVFSLSYPLAARAEWRPFSHFEYRIIATAWSSLIGGASWSGCRIEIPTFPQSRYWLFAEYNLYDYQYLYLSTEPVKSDRTQIFTAGIRFGSIF